jgi:hypothetical protein
MRKVCREAEGRRAGVRRVRSDVAGAWVERSKARCGSDRLGAKGYLWARVAKISFCSRPACRGCARPVSDASRGARVRGGTLGTRGGTAGRRSGSASGRDSHMMLFSDEVSEKDAVLAGWQIPAGSAIRCFAEVDRIPGAGPGAARVSGSAGRVRWAGARESMRERGPAAEVAVTGTGAYGRAVEAGCHGFDRPFAKADRSSSFGLRGIRRRLPRGETRSRGPGEVWLSRPSCPVGSACPVGCADPVCSAGHGSCRTRRVVDRK